MRTVAPVAACAGGRNRPQAKDRLISSFATAVGVELLGVLVGVPARAVIQRLAGPPAAAQAGWRWPGIEPAWGLLWFAVTLRLAGQGLGGAVPAYLALAFVCLVLAVIDAATRLLPNRSTYPAFPVVAGLLLAASLGLGELGRLGRGLLALLAPHGMGWAMASWPRPWAWRSAGCRGGRWRWGGGRLPARRPGGAGRHAGTWPVAH